MRPLEVGAVPVLPPAHPGHRAGRDQGQDDGHTEEEPRTELWAPARLLLVTGGCETSDHVHRERVASRCAGGGGRRLRQARLRAAGAPAEVRRLVLPQGQARPRRAGHGGRRQGGGGGDRTPGAARAGAERAALPGARGDEDRALLDGTRGRRPRRQRLPPQLRDRRRRMGRRRQGLRPADLRPRRRHPARGPRAAAQDPHAWSCCDTRCRGRGSSWTRKDERPAAGRGRGATGRAAGADAGGLRRAHRWSARAAPGACRRWTPTPARPGHRSGGWRSSARRVRPSPPCGSSCTSSCGSWTRRPPGRVGSSSAPTGRCCRGCSRPSGVDDPELEKGELLVAHRRKGGVVATERHRAG